MNKKSLVGIVIGLMMATSTVYFVETSEELFEEQDMIKGPFFLVVAVAYIPVAFWMLKSPNSSMPYIVTIAGTVGIIALYAVTRTDAGAMAFGLEHAGSIGHLGMVSKVVQVGVVIGSVWALIQTKKEAWMQNEGISNVRKQC
ncbi:MAG: hypothetical protein GKS07_11250 [Nitrosopumilus sp.]|nr:MAG: hypothetical protein GKS07_00105 [Nitrosopumilus sp.]QMU55413.1 MAG: hypothetical protein GKS07_11250 [Nitrosopumilus sp.]